jgi:hypothetical protein
MDITKEHLKYIIEEELLEMINEEEKSDAAKIRDSINKKYFSLKFAPNSVSAKAAKKARMQYDAKEEAKQAFKKHYGREYDPKARLPAIPGLAGGLANHLEINPDEAKFNRIYRQKLGLKRRARAAHTAGGKYLDIGGTQSMAGALGDYFFGKGQQSIEQGKKWRRDQKKSARHQNESMESDENDITKADLKRVIREELEAFLDDHYSK